MVSNLLVVEMSKEYKSTLRQELESGEVVILDRGFHNSIDVEVITQTSGKLFTTVKSGEQQWDVMTNRLTKKE